MSAARALPARCAELAARALAATVLPPVCCLCGAGGTAPYLDLCGICRELLPLNEPACVRCAGPLPAAAAANASAECAACARRPPAFVAAFAPFRYAYPVDHCVQALKFRGERVHARVLGLLLAGERQLRGGVLPERLLPVPLHRARYRERGFNQAAELARFAGRALGVAVETGWLERVGATGAQSGLSLAARRRNVRGAFRARGTLPPCRVALVDDVLTTGSTAAEAARALCAAGVRRVEIWAAARVVLE